MSDRRLYPNLTPHTVPIYIYLSSIVLFVYAQCFLIVTDLHSMLMLGLVRALRRDGEGGQASHRKLRCLVVRCLIRYGTVSGE